jgi:hypothetical protein
MAIIWFKCRFIEATIIRSGGGTVLSERFGSPRPPPAFSFDGEFGREEDQIPPEHENYEADRRLLPSLGVVLATACLGVVLALLWHNVGRQLWVTAQGSPSSAPQQRSGTASAEQLAEIEALKRNIAELHDSQQQLAASLASLQAGLRELQQHSWSKPLSWYSEPKLLVYRGVMAQHPSPAASVKPKSTTRPSQDTNVAKHDQGVPVPSVSERP